MTKKLQFVYLMPLLFLSLGSFAQIKISGRVIDGKDKPLKGASVSLLNTLDGATTDTAGYFSFVTTETGNQTLVASESRHSDMGIPILITKDTAGIILRMRVAVLESVTITAGSFGSADRAKTVMNPIDVVTTAGSNGDMVKAMEMLPGTQQTSTENGLFIRGGDASEAAMIVDETIVQTAFASGPPGMATRSRFNTFQFQGVSFSSGGYSAKYGQALSGILELNSTDVSDKSTVNLGVYMAGCYASGTKRWKNSSLDVGGNYNNLAPMYAIATTNFKPYKVPQGTGANARYAWTPNKNAIFKASVSGSYNTSGFTLPNPNPDTTDKYNPIARQGDTVNFLTKDTYFMGTLSYKETFKGKYMLYTAASYSIDKTNNMLGNYPLKQDEYRVQYRIEGTDYITSRVTLLAGTDIQSYGIKKDMGESGLTIGGYTLPVYDQKFDETLVSGYTELQWTPIYWLSLRPGLRYEHSALLNSNVIAPRFSAAIRTGNHSQVSLAGGIFYQDAANYYYLAGLRPDMQQAIHYIVQWQRSKNDRTLRVETYYKDYEHLVREMVDSNTFVSSRNRFINPYIPITNKGYGYAQGLEFFWRDKKSIKNADYWISYSYIDTKRLYENFLYNATPTFIAQHTLSIVGKYFVDKWQTNFSATYSYANGFPYYNPEVPKNSSTFLADKTPPFNNVALTVAYLHSFGKWFSVFYMSIDNVLNSHNISGYRYAYDKTGTVVPGSKTEIIPGIYRLIFVGANFSLTKFSKDEL